MRRPVKKSWGRTSVEDALAIVGYDPLAAFIQMACDETMDIKIRYSANKELLEWLIPKPKKIEVTYVDKNEEQQKEMLSKLDTLIAQYAKNF